MHMETSYVEVSLSHSSLMHRQDKTEEEAKASLPRRVPLFPCRPTAFCATVGLGPLKRTVARAHAEANRKVTWLLKNPMNHICMMMMMHLVQYTCSWLMAAASSRRRFVWYGYVSRALPSRGARGARGEMLESSDGLSWS